MDHNEQVTVTETPPPVALPRRDDDAEIDALDYLYPLRPGLVVLLRRIPRDLTPLEAARLGAFVRTLVCGEGDHAA